MKEEKSSLFKEGNEWHSNQHQIYSEEFEDSKEDHDSHINGESTSDFGAFDWGIRYDCRNEDPMVPQDHKNELKEEENALPLQINNVCPYEALPSDWKGLFFMFQDDSIK